MVRGRAFAAALRLVTSASLLLVSTAGATVVLPADFATVVDGSQAIVHGRVSDVRSLMAGDRRSIYSLVTVTVQEVLKGARTSTVTFRVPNGQVGRYRRVVVGAPEFARGDEVVVFLSGQAPAVPAPFGLNQGVYRVGRSADGRSIVAPPPVLARGVDAERVVRGDPARVPMELAAFVREVRRRAEALP